jgi:hypothetical protein
MNSPHSLDNRGYKFPAGVKRCPPLGSLLYFPMPFINGAYRRKIVDTSTQSLVYELTCKRQQPVRIGCGNNYLT